VNEPKSENFQGPNTSESISQLEIVGRLRAHLSDVLPDAETLWQQSNTRNIAFRGHLAMDSTQAYALLRERFATLGYTPLLRRQSGYDLIIAIHHLFQSKPTRWGINVILFLLTLVTTTVMGAVMEQGELLQHNLLLFFQRPWLLLTGVPASLTIMGILGIHELAHYFVARRHGLGSSLPYFIPVPFGFGTFGAIIRIQTPWENRKALFDVGIAGPLAGALVALPLFFVGLLTSQAMPPIPEGMPLGSPLLLRWIEDWVYAIRGLPEHYEIYVNAMTFAAWFGLVVTGFNLLPIGQLDGGHVAYALLGRWARVVGAVILIGLLTLGMLAWQGWFVWAAFIFFSGWQHPAPLNSLAPLGKKRAILGILILVLTILLFTPAPFPVQSLL
jgi:Zn-dependent protease